MNNSDSQDGSWTLSTRGMISEKRQRGRPAEFERFATTTPGTKRGPPGDLTACRYERVMVRLQALHVHNVAPSTAHVRRWFNEFDQVVDRVCAFDDTIGAFILV